MTLRLPPLRERPEDSPLLVEHYFALANQEEGTEVRPPRGRSPALVRAAVAVERSARDPPSCTRPRPE